MSDISYSSVFPSDNTSRYKLTALLKVKTNHRVLCSDQKPLMVHFDLIAIK